CVTCGVFCLYFVFFFSSRRRHTRSKRDWSSDVCSSDLFFAGALAGCSSDDDTGGSNSGGDGEISGDMEIQYFVGGYGDEWWKKEIGRASCRERGERGGGGEAREER